MSYHSTIWNHKRPLTGFASRPKEARSRAILADNREAGVNHNEEHLVMTYRQNSTTAAHDERPPDSEAPMPSAECNRPVRSRVPDPFRLHPRRSHLHPRFRVALVPHDLLWEQPREGAGRVCGEEGGGEPPRLPIGLWPGEQLRPPGEEELRPRAAHRHAAGGGYDDHHDRPAQGREREEDERAEPGARLRAEGQARAPHRPRRPEEQDERDRDGRARSTPSKTSCFVPR